MNGCLNVTESADATVLATFHEGKTSINQPQGNGFVGALTQVKGPNNISLVQLPSSKIGTRTHKSSTGAYSLRSDEMFKVTLQFGIITHPLNHVLTGDGLQLQSSPTNSTTLCRFENHYPLPSTTFS